MISNKRDSTELDQSDSSDVKKIRIDDKSDSSKFLKLRGFVASRKGEREVMQDAHVVMDKVDSNLGAQTKDLLRMAFYGVFDGHGGDKAAKFTADKFLPTFLSKFPKGDSMQTVEKGLKQSFLESYRKLDEEFLSEATKSKPVWKDGTTATTLVVLNDLLLVANIGDSRAVLCRYKAELAKDIGISLTRDHNPTVFEERMRVEKAGGHVKDGRVMGILEVSRSIGDGQLKKLGVTCIPDVKRISLTPNDRYILMACDGLWKSFEVAEAIELVSKCLKVDRISQDGQSQWDLRWQSAAAKLASEAVRRGSGDNVTVVLIAIGQAIEQFNLVI